MATDSVSSDIREATLVSWIGGALDYYLPSGLKSHYIRENTAQDIQNFFLENKYFDLVKRISEYSIIALEVKYNYGADNGGVELRKYKGLQHTILLALEDFGIPVHYCYNRLGSSELETKRLGDLLAANNAPKPRELLTTNGKIASNIHKNLKEVVDDMLSASGASSESALALFGVIAGTDASAFGVRQLLLAYHQPTKKLIIVDEDDVRRIRNVIESQMKVKLQIARPRDENSVDEWRKAFSRFVQACVLKIKEHDENMAKQIEQLDADDNSNTPACR